MLFVSWTHIKSKNVVGNFINHFILKYHGHIPSFPPPQLHFSTPETGENTTGMKGLWIQAYMARSIPMDQAPCAGEFVRLPISLSQVCVVPFIWPSPHLGPLFPVGKKLTSLPCLYCKLIHCMYFELSVADLTYVPFSLLIYHCTWKKKDGTLLTVEVATSSWMLLMVSTEHIILCQQLFASPIFLEFKPILLLGTQ